MHVTCNCVIVASGPGTQCLEQMGNPKHNYLCAYTTKAYIVMLLIIKETEIPSVGLLCNVLYESKHTEPFLKARFEMDIQMHILAIQPKPKTLVQHQGTCQTARKFCVEGSCRLCKCRIPLCLIVQLDVQLK